MRAKKNEAEPMGAVVRITVLGGTIPELEQQAEQRLDALFAERQYTISDFSVEEIRDSKSGEWNYFAHVVASDSTRR